MLDKLIKKTKMLTKALLLKHLFKRKFDLGNDAFNILKI